MPNIHNTAGGGSTKADCLRPKTWTMISHGVLLRPEYQDANVLDSLCAGEVKRIFGYESRVQRTIRESLLDEGSHEVEACSTVLENGRQGPQLQLMLQDAIRVPDSLYIATVFDVLASCPYGQHLTTSILILGIF